MIIRGGENIYPREIEELVYRHPAVQDVQVVAVPSKKFGEEVCAFVITKKDMTATAKEIQDFVAHNMSRHKVPAMVLFAKEFPMTASGKIQKYKLREIAEREAQL
jgi:fatty-acyl-CoA synthase